MLTARGYWFFVTVLALLGLGAVIGAHVLTLLGLTLLPWFLVQWFLFRWRLRAVDQGLRVERMLVTTRGPSESLWARQRAEVRVNLHTERRVALPYVVVFDRLPVLAQLQDGALQTDGPLSPQEPLALTYHLACPAPGKLRFEGVQVQVADLHGFFAAVRFVRAPRTYRVLPALAAEASQPTFVKRQNVLPLLGAHRHPRPGSGTELLDLRDYLPGDPPKMIAWKVSARRDRLMTRELESEVPIRCTLFLDVSSSVRVGPPGRTALARLVEVAAGVAQAAAEERDLTGLCLFDEHGVHRLLRPGRGPRHLMQLLDALTDAAGLMPHNPQARLDQLLPYGYALAQDLYPDLLDADVNAFPFWLPFWSPQPVWAVPPPAGRPSTVRGWLREQVRLSPLMRVARSGRRFSPAQHRRYRRRKQLAAILAVRYDLGPGGLALLLEDDLACADYLQRFLAEHQVTYPLPLYDEAGHYLFSAPGKVPVLADALLKSVLRGKDNELFVLCVDLFEVGPALHAVERAATLARARHHQVVVICPWPQGVPLPSRPDDTTPPAQGGAELTDLLTRATVARLHQAYAHVRQAFGRLGVPVVCAAADETVALILQRVQRLRVRERGVPR